MKRLIFPALVLFLLAGCHSPQAESAPPEIVSPTPSPSVSAVPPSSHAPTASPALEPASSPTPELEPAPSLTPEPEPSFGPEEREAVFRQFLSEVEAAFPEPQPFSIVPDKRGYRSYGSFAVSDVDDAVYLASRDGPNYSESLWAWENGAGNCLYSPGEWMDCNINVAGDQIFLWWKITPDDVSGLCRIPCAGGELRLVSEDLYNVKLVGRTVFALYEGVLLTFPLDRPEERTVIWTAPPDVSSYNYIPFEDGIILEIIAHTQEENVYIRCLYYCGADGTRKLLDYNVEESGYWYTDLQVSDGNVYFSHNPGFRDAQIYQIDLDTGEKTLCCVIPSLYRFQVYDGKLYLSFWSTLGKFSRAELDGSGMEDLVAYENGGEQNILDLMKPMEMAVTKEYLYLYGYSDAAGGQWVTRIPLNGSDRQEKAFFYGEWLAPEEFTEKFYAIPFHPS